MCISSDDDSTLAYSFNIYYSNSEFLVMYYKIVFLDSYDMRVDSHYLSTNNLRFPILISDNNVIISILN